MSLENTLSNLLRAFNNVSVDISSSVAQPVEMLLTLDQKSYLHFYFDNFLRLKVLNEPEVRELSCVKLEANSLDFKEILESKLSQYESYKQNKLRILNPDIATKKIALANIIIDKLVLTYAKAQD